MNALFKVIHPTFGESIVTLNMVRAVLISENGIKVDMVMNCPGCAAGQVTLAHAHRTLRSLLEAEDQEIVISLVPESWKAPWEF